MIDAPDCGTNLDALASVGNNIINSDSKKNIIFSAHSYWYAYANNDSLTYLNKINNAINANIPFVFGEIANLQDDQQMCQYVLNYKPLLSICETKKIGWLAWSWDNDGCSQRQVSTEGSYSSLTPYGNVVVNNSVYGMRLTAKKSKYLTNSINISIAGPTQYCGTPISITASGGVSYKWSNNATTATISVGAAGTYTVTATDACGHTATANKTIGNACCSMSGMNFKYQTSNAYNKQVFFYAPTVTGCSNGTKTYLWSFGSGASTPTSTASQPGYITYTTSGLKTVSVTITCTLTDGSTCTMTCSKNVMVSDYQIMLNANFGYSISASNPLLTTFAAPTNPAGTTYLWQIFNSSNAQIHSATTTNISSYIFSAAGNYNVCLTTTGTTAPSGMNMHKKVCKTITLMSTCNLTPRIVAVQNSATNSYTIAFNNAAVGTVSTWEWDFGDGSPVVTTTNATRTYTTSGTYMVCLTVNKGQANCEGKVCMPVSVGASTCSNSATTATPTSTPIPPTNAILLENGIIYYDSDKMGEIDPVAFPNPTSAKTNILLGKYAAFDNTITVSDIQGRVLLQQTTGKGNPQTDLDLVELPQGVYIITIKDENGNFTNLKILHD
jgi:PKD repeat protein